jgi:hypothetical protein
MGESCEAATPTRWSERRCLPYGGTAMSTAMSSKYSRTKQRRGCDHCSGVAACGCDFKLKLHYRPASHTSRWP